MPLAAADAFVFLSISIVFAIFSSIDDSMDIFIFDILFSIAICISCRNVAMLGSGGLLGKVRIVFASLDLSVIVGFIRRGNIYVPLYWAIISFSFLRLVVDGFSIFLGCISR